MDRALLLETLASTLVPAHSRRAEQALGVLEQQQGFAPALLEIVFSGADLGVRRAAAVYFKNKITRSWPPGGADPLAAADREFVKQHIVPSIVKAVPALREFFLVSLATMLSYEFRNDAWPQLLPQIMELLQNTQDLPGVAAGLAVLKQVCKFYRWQNYANNKKLTPLMATFFPTCVQIAEAATSALLQGDEQDLYYQLVYEVFKVYKLSTSRYLPETMREDGLSRRTIALFINIFVLQPRQKGLQYPDKCQKWATANVVRTYSTYLTKSYMSLSENGPAYAPYRQLFVSTFSPEITRLYVEQLQLWSANRREMTGPVLSNVITYLSAMVDIKQVYTAMLEPHLDGLVRHVAFRLLSPTEDDQDLFEDDPVEFINRNMSYGDRANAPAADAGMFVHKLARKRRNTLPFVLQFLDESARTLAQQPDAVAPKAGVLSMLQALAPLLLGKAAVDVPDLEPFVAEFVLPDLTSRHAFLRTVACETVSKLAALEYKNNETLLVLFNGLLDSFMNPKCLPLQVAAALALQALSMAPHNGDIRQALGAHISNVVSTLLALTEKVDSESLLGVLDHFVDLYPDQITPFAIDLASHLCTQFASLASEITEITENNAGLADNEVMMQNDEKITAGLSIMNSLCNLQSALEHRPDLTAQLDAVIAPIFTQVYVQRMVDFYPDCLTLHENSLFSMKQIPERQWEYFDLLTHMLEQDEIDYFEEVMPVMENYILYGSQSLAATAPRLQAFTQLLVGLFAPRPLELSAGPPNDEHTRSAAYSEARTRGHVMSLLVKLLTSSELVKGPMVPFLPQIVQTVSDRVRVDAQNGVAVPPRYNVALVSVVLACLFNEPLSTLAVLDQAQSTASFFEMWYQTAQEFVRVTDYKLEEMAVLSLIVAASHHPIVSANLGQLVHILCDALAKMPEAVRKIMEMLKAEESAWDDDDLDDSYFLDDEDDDAVEVTVVPAAAEAATLQQDGAGNFVYEDPGQGRDEAEQGAPDAPNTEAGNESASNDVSSHIDLGLLSDDFDEHLYAMNPLDKLNPYNALRAAWSSLQDDTRQHLFSMMEDGDRRVFESSMLIEALVDPKDNRK